MPGERPPEAFKPGPLFITTLRHLGICLPRASVPVTALHGPEESLMFLFFDNTATKCKLASASDARRPGD